jgi:ubiquinone/menaquinone biosynthesis C-methylase UbiE
VGEDASRLSRFGAVDASADPDQFVRFLEATDSLPDVRARRHRSYELLEVVEGQAVVDVGCGLGAAAGELAEIVGPPGRVVGIDSSETMLELARRRMSDASLSLVFEQADATELPLADVSVDGYRAERLYQHLPDVAGSLAEARRVLRPEGRLVLVDQDFETFLVDADDREITRRLLNHFCDSIRNGWIGRQYQRLLSDAEFVDVDVLPDTQLYTDFGFWEPLLGQVVGPAIADGAVGDEEGAAWLADQRRRAAEGRFLVSMTHFLAGARRP